MSPLYNIATTVHWGIQITVFSSHMLLKLKVRNSQQTVGQEGIKMKLNARELAIYRMLLSNPFSH